jgi:hypothetical protein
MNRKHFPFRRSVRFAIAIALLAAIGCGTAAPPEKTPQEIEKSRMEHQERTARELSGK